jgi:hypothetical protein
VRRELFHLFKALKVSGTF